MHALTQSIKSLLEKAFHCKIYGDSLPRGADFFTDLEKLGDAGRCRTIIDVGAHHGESVAKYLGHFPNARVLALEPSVESFELLKTKFADARRASFFNVAAGAASGQATLYMKPNTSTHSLRLADGAVSQEMVRVTTLDEFCENEKLDGIDFCKIDTEGADLQVLQGAAKMLGAQRIKLVQVETSTRHDTDYFSNFFEIDRLLAGHGYELFGIYEQMPCWTGRQSILFFNAVFIASSVVGHLPVWENENVR